MKKPLLLVLTLTGFGLYGFLGLALYPYFLITGFKEAQVRKFFYMLARGVFWVVKRAAKSFTLEGAQNIPAGAAVIAANHSSILDILCMAEFGREDIIFITRGWPSKVPVMGAYVRAAGNIRLEDTGGSDAALKAAAASAFRKGLKIIVFPEGARGPEGVLRRFRSGAFMLALDFKVPLVPVALKGLGGMIPKSGFWVNATDIKISALPPVENFSASADGAPALKMAQYVKTLIAKKLEEK
ncbi:MAG: 1-acyl-sn-glycerol-3-phosphate acyltransferase [Elusimicrobiota bacterium]|jgi:1-acyl-sn-glycerol-3-phosphate acyltransferase|nr:1-acyl-sn-glycerol-3-phosphate acyltransferase [Elusimicrobiota bacterium]